MTVLSIELLTEATKVWGRFRQGKITYRQLENELAVIEARYGVVRYGRPTGDDIDRGWDAYKDHGEQIGGQL
jgi:hypothetical protein